MDIKFPWISDQPREQIKKEAGGGVREVFRRTSALLFGNARGNLIALIIAPGAYLRRCLVTRTSSALVCACLRSRGPPLRPTKSQISHFVFAPSVLNLSCRFCRMLRTTLISVRSILTMNALLYLALYIERFPSYFFTLSRSLYTRRQRHAMRIIHGIVYILAFARRSHTWKSAFNENLLLLFLILIPRERDFERNIIESVE